MQRQVALAALAIATAFITAAYGAAFLPGGQPGWAPWLVALGTAMLLPAFMLLGTARSGTPLGRLVWPIAFTFVVVAGGFALALGLPAERAGSALWFGLPPRAAVLLYGIGLLPALALPLAYALTFDERTLSEDDLARVRDMARARDEGRGANSSGGPSPLVADSEPAR
jgi:hypothetical protein